MDKYWGPGKQLRAASPLVVSAFSGHHLHYVIRCSPGLRVKAQALAAECGAAGLMTYWVKVKPELAEGSWELVGPFDHKPSEMPYLLPAYAG